MKTRNQAFFRVWLRVSLFNFLLVATAGVLLRAKILYPLPLIDHKFLLHAHSHFAFSGWLTQVLAVCITERISRTADVNLKKLRFLFWLNTISSYGMLFTFPFMGYAGPSIFFSTLSIVFSIWFSISCWQLLSRSGWPAVVLNWFRTALLSLVVSCAGPIVLAILMATKTGSSHSEIKSVYWFLHFQYNGFFLFGILGLFFAWAIEQGKNTGYISKFFVFMALTLAPSYLLSIQWLELPPLWQALATISGSVQVGALAIFCLYLFRIAIRQAGILWILAFTAFSLKVLFQFIAVFPSLGKIAFGYRPIVIGYLHLVLLGCITLFVLGYLVKESLIQFSAVQKWGIGILVTGIFLNEILLFLQGLQAVLGNPLPHINELLLAVSLLMWGGLLMMQLGKRGK